jgi:hypothetical protein
MEHSHYPFATQDWSLIRHRTLTLQAAQVRAVESVAIPCHAGNVVVEATSSTAMVRVALAAQSPLIERIGPSFAQAFTVSVTQPIAAALCRIGGQLRKLAVQLDPKLARG